MRTAAWTLALCAVALAACGDGGETTPATGAVPAPISTVETTVPSEPTPPASSPPTTGATTESTPPGDSVPVDLLEPLLVDAANRAGVTVDDVSIVETELRDFSDSSLGCPQPGMMYTQVITPGYRVVLEAGGTQYDYRMNRRGSFRLCERPGPVPDVRTPPTVIPTSSTVAGD